MEFYVKLGLRIVHILSASFVIGNILGDYAWGKRVGQGYTPAFIASGVLLLVTGLINMVLLRPTQTMGSFSAIWRSLVKFKLLLWCLLLPLPEMICRQAGVSFNRVAFNVPLVLVIVLVSCYMKQHRDWAVVNKPEDVKSK